MASFGKKRQQNRRHPRQLDDFDKDDIISDNWNNGQQNVIFNDSTVDREITVNNNGTIPTTNEITMNVQTLERCLNERIDRQMGNIGDTVEDSIQNAILIAIESINTPRIELAVKAIETNSGHDATSVTANSQHGKRMGINDSFENVSGSICLIWADFQLVKLR